MDCATLNLPAALAVFASPVVGVITGNGWTLLICSTAIQPPRRASEATIGCRSSACLQRLRDWVTVSGTRLDRDRPTRQTVWPGEDRTVDIVEHVITDRDADFVEFVIEQVQARQAAEDAFFATIDERTGEIPD